MIPGCTFPSLPTPSSAPPRTNGGDPLDESDFWVNLEFRVCAELAGLRDRRFRSLWCDGFLPDTVVTDADAHATRIVGRVWMGYHNGHQEPWDFSLRLGPAGIDRRSVDWSVLLPADDVTGWLFIDVVEQTMRINPAAARPDPPAPP